LASGRVVRSLEDGTTEGIPLACKVALFRTIISVPRWVTAHMQARHSLDSVDSNTKAVERHVSNILQVLQIKRILFPIDFSEQTYATAPLVRAMASRFKAQVVLLTVVPGDSALIDAAQMMEDLEPRMDCVFRREFADLPVKRVVELGEPAEVIARFADTQGVDLIMMPTHGCGPLRRLLLGSVAAKVVHDAQCPVWTNVNDDPPELAEEPILQTVVCGLERTPDSSPVIEWAGQFAEQVGASLRFVHVIAAPDELAVRLTKLKRDRMQREALGSVEDLQRRTGVKGPTSVVIGKIGSRFCEEAQQHHADLVVIGRGKVDDFGRLGKNAYDIIRRAPCPVINV